MHRLFALAALTLAPALPADEPFDHVETIRSLRHNDVKAGRALYATHCASCHGVDGKLALNPLARRFAVDELKFGTDPYALWKTTSYGNGLMFRWDAVLTAKERYQIVHHIREEIIKPNNPSQYFQPDDAYFDALPAIAEKDAAAQAANTQKVEAAPGMIDGTAGQNMVYGPFLQHTVTFAQQKNKNADHFPDTTEKALIVDLGDGQVICYDAERLSVAALWSGKIADTSKTHHTSYKGGSPLKPGGPIAYRDIDAHGWQGGRPKLLGHYLHGDHVALHYQVADRNVLETPSSIPGSSTISRTFKVSPGSSAVRCLIGHVPGAKPIVQSTHAVLAGKDRNLSAQVSADIPGATFTADANSRLWFDIPATDNPLEFSIHFEVTDEMDPSEISPTRSVPDFTAGGPRRWPHTVQTAVARGTDDNAYTLDELTVPLANPYGAWMRTTALDFFSDGRLAVSTLSGDVWIVSWEKDTPDALTWSRFATGLYEPLGLKVVDDTVLVRGRDRITRLHDLNGDGEADHYESFYEDTNTLGPSYHAFVYELQTDRAGHLYFSQSGYKSPLEGAVVRLDPDGTNPTVVATDLRNPNGMGAGGPHDWVTITDNPSGKAVYNGIALLPRRSEPVPSLGFEGGRDLPMLAVLPARVDSSSGGQCWTDPERFGPLSGAIAHTSYSRCAAFYVLVQTFENPDKHPNGFAVRFPFDLKSGAMRPRTNPVDGQLYIACQKGWDTTATHDGLIARIRHTGKPAHTLTAARADHDGIALTFASPLDPKSVTASSVTAARETDNKKAKPELLKLGAVKLTAPATVHLTIPDIDKETVAHRTRTDRKTGNTTVGINHPIAITVNFTSKDGTPVHQTVYATINALP